MSPERTAYHEDAHGSAVDAITLAADAQCRAAHAVELARQTGARVRSAREERQKTRHAAAPEQERGVNSSTRRPRDRRNHHRADVHLPAESMLLGNSLAGLTRFTTETLNLGEGGAKIAVPEELPLGQRLGIHIHLPDGTDHPGRARVLRSGPSPDRVGETGTWATGFWSARTAGVPSSVSRRSRRTWC